MPATVSAVLFKNATHADAAFAQEASYLFQEEDDAVEATKPEAFNISYRTLECTKRMMALKLWVAFSLYGSNGLGALVDEAFSKARLFARFCQTASRSGESVNIPLMPIMAISVV